MSSPEAALADVRVPLVLGDLPTAISSVHAYCSVYTRSDVASAMLDAVGWRVDADLTGQRLLEPCCGDGAFLLPAVARLLSSARSAGRLSELSLGDTIRAFEFDPTTASHVRRAVEAELRDAGLPASSARRLAHRWVRCEDFLLTEGLGTFTHVVGNPPYLRWSKLPTLLRSRYEAALPKAFARGDLCLAFLWRAVDAMDSSMGVVAFLCADRWLRCAYGEEARGKLRPVVRVAAHIEAHGLPVFAGERKVSAYAAVTVLDGRSGEGGTVAKPATLKGLIDALGRLARDGRGRRSSSLLRSSGGSLIGSSALRDALIATADRNPTLLGAGATIRCGVALGCAKAFIVDADADVEADRLLPFVRSADLTEDGRTTAVKRLLNVWSHDGKLAELGRYPRLAALLTPWRRELEKRACVVDPHAWYRTIDRVHEDLGTDRILIAGMAKRSRVALAGTGEQPGNAVYVLTSAEWPLSALYALFRSGLLDVFAAGLAPTFSGASRRFDGNFLRQVRIPLWSEVDPSLKRKIEEVDVSMPLARPDLIADILGLRAHRQRKAVSDALAAVWPKVGQ